MWFALIIATLGLALGVCQATMSGPALPVTLDLLAMVLAAVTTLLLAIRLVTTGAPLAIGAYLGVLCGAGVTVGAFRALHGEQGWTPGPDRPVELVERRGSR